MIRVDIAHDLSHDRYYNYAELTQHVQALAAAFPHLCRL